MSQLLRSAGLFVQLPAVLSTCTDYIVDGTVRVQDKARTMATSTGGYRVSLQKHGRRILKAGKYRQTCVPYSAYDFDVLTLSMWDRDDFLGFFVMPAAELCRQGLLGRAQLLTVFPPWSTPLKQAGKIAKQWQVPFFFSVLAAA